MLVHEKMEGKAKQQGWKKSWKGLLWQEPPISIPSEKVHGLCSSWLCWVGAGGSSHKGAVTGPTGCPRGQLHFLLSAFAVCSLSPWEGAGSCDTPALPSTESPCQEPSLPPVPKHGETTGKKRGVATPLCCHKSSWLKINCC